MAFDHDFLDLAEQATFNQELEVLAGHPGQQALQPRASLYSSPSGRAGSIAVASS